MPLDYEEGEREEPAAVVLEAGGHTFEVR